MSIAAMDPKGIGFLTIHCAATPEGRAFHEQMRQLEEFVEFASRMADRVAMMKHGFAIQMAAKLLG